MPTPQCAVQGWDARMGALAEQIGAEQIELISNGSGVDNDFAYAVWQALSPKYPGLSVCTSIESPADLIQRIGNYKALAAYRMHATVVAMALDVPVIGLAWEPNVLQILPYFCQPKARISLDEFIQHP